MTTTQLTLTAATAALTQLDGLVRAYTAFSDLADLLNQPKNYRPTIITTARNKRAAEIRRAAYMTILADAYDAAMVAMDDERRAYRGF